MTRPVAWAALLSFLIGSFGYVVARLVIRPLLRYQILKTRIRQALDAPGKGGTELWRGTLREYAGALTVCHNEQLPNWYRLALKNRGEAPLEAARHLMTLANVSRPEHAARRTDDIRRVLHLPGAKERP